MPPEQSSTNHLLSLQQRRQYQLIRRKIQESTQSIFGYHALAMGEACAQFNFLKGVRIPHQMTLSDQIGSGAKVISEFHALPFSASELDLIVAIKVMEHTAEPHGLLRELERVLQPEGQLLLLSVNPYSVAGIHARLKNLPLGELGRKVNLYNNRRLKDWLQVLGFEIVNKQRFSTSHRWMPDQLQPWLGDLSLLQVKKRQRRFIPIGLKQSPRRILKPVPQPVSSVQADRVSGDHG